jgi:glycosyltransferase involved in cell wall biosynthesis
MKVSVLMITYNHEKFIAQAIESVLMQVTNFKYEIVIGEDCSNDRTREIVIDYQKRFPDKVRLLLREKNIGGAHNFSQTLLSCTGKYVAILDGDDYWLSPHKLQKQVDFLEGHPECSICFHPVWAVVNGQLDHIGPNNLKEYSTFEDLLRENYIPTCSVMFVNKLLKHYPEWIYGLSMGDWPLLLSLAQYGKIGCLRTAMGAYRVHGAGVWSSLKEKEKLQRTIEFYECIHRYFGPKYKKNIRQSLAVHYYGLASMYNQEQNFSAARRCLFRVIIVQSLNGEKPQSTAIRMLMRVSFPKMYAYTKKLLKPLSDKLIRNL